MDPFWYKLALSFIVGGLWITLITVAAENVGSRLGGLLGGLPSTMVVALLFIGITQGPAQAREATTALPLALVGNVLFAAAFALLVPRGLAAGLAGGFVAWFALQALFVGLGIRDYALVLAIWAVGLVGGYVLLDGALGLREQVQASVTRTWGQMLGRAVLSGSIVASAVLATRLSGPILGGVLAGMPAVLSSTLLITTRSAGAPFARAILVPIIVSALVNCTVYATVMRLSVLSVGIVGASLLSYAAAVPSVWLVHRFLQWRARRLA